MATNETVYKTIVIRGSSEGVEKLAADLQKLAAANENVAVSTEKVTLAQSRVEKSFASLEKRNVIAVRQADEVAKTLKDIEAAKVRGIGSGERYNAILAGMTQRHEAASRSQKSLADTTKLSRYELINLSRQVQDVGVSLASGQSPFTVLVQQGTQIADVFAASQTTVRQFFSQAVGWAGRFVTSTAGVVDRRCSDRRSRDLLRFHLGRPASAIFRGL